MKDKITIFVFLFGIVITAVCLFFAVPRVFPILATLLAVSVILYRFFDAAAKVNDMVKITGAGGVMVALFLGFFAFTKDDMEKPVLDGGRPEGREAAGESRLLRWLERASGPPLPRLVR